MVFLFFFPFSFLDWNGNQKFYNLMLIAGFHSRFLFELIKKKKKKKTRFEIQYYSMIFLNKETKSLTTADTSPHIKLTNAFYLLNVRTAIKWFNAKCKHKTNAIRQLPSSMWLYVKFNDFYLQSVAINQLHAVTSSIFWHIENFMESCALHFSIFCEIFNDLQNFIHIQTELSWVYYFFLSKWQKTDDTRHKQLECSLFEFIQFIQ